MTATEPIPGERAKTLAKTQKDYERAASQFEEIRQRRNTELLDAARSGWTHAMISRASRSTGARGLTRSRVGQLLMSTNERVTHRVLCSNCGEHHATVVGPPAWDESDVLNAFREQGRVVKGGVVCSRCADNAGPNR
jgi:hypothetical protein